jgi:hypothetical protein
MADPKLANTHRNLMQDPRLQTSLDVAMMEYRAQLALQTPDGNFNSCAEAHIKAKGALEFIHVLKNLGEQVKVPSIVNRDNLDHELK